MAVEILVLENFSIIRFVDIVILYVFHNQNHLNSVTRKQVFGAYTNNNPAGIRRLVNVVLTSMQGHDVASTLMRGCFNVVCPMGRS